MYYNFMLEDEATNDNYLWYGQYEGLLECGTFITIVQHFNT